MRKRANCFDYAWWERDDDGGSAGTRERGRGARMREGRILYMETKGAIRPGARADE